MELCKDYDVELIIFYVRTYDDLMVKIRVLGHLDAVVNAAGLSIVKKTIEEQNGLKYLIQM